MKTTTGPFGDACMQAFHKGYDWFLGQQQPDGSLGTPPTDEATFYNALYLFAIGGRWRELNRFLVWARENIIDPDGTLHVDREGVFATRAVYFKAWHIWGAHFCGLFDMSLKTIDRLLPCQDARCGGFRVSERGCDSGSGFAELNTTGMAGLACLVTGAMKQASAAGDFVVDLLNGQPDLAKGLYGYYDPSDGTLITSWPQLGRDEQQRDDVYRDSQSTQTTDLDKYLFYYDNESDEVQAYANLGAPLAFLCHLHRATGKDSYLEAAMKLFGCLDSAGEKCWIKGQTTKVLWGLAQLYNITGDRRVFHGLQTLADHLCEVQLPDGRWLATIAFDDIAKQPRWVSIAIAGDVLLSLAAVP
jgi:hypothetical protein